MVQYLFYFVDAYYFGARTKLHETGINNTNYLAVNLFAV